MHFKRRGKRGRNDGSSKKRHNREKALFKRLDRRRERYRLRREDENYEEKRDLNRMLEQDYILLK